ncbi:PAS domain S-box protein [Streptomyces sp. NPDC059352]|uniref:PAS domain S-box protein n=1 Tax=Streptomyces sp. NPDC059352 TaxID=3346810 RepID=UPI0036BFC74C
MSEPQTPGRIEVRAPSAGEWRTRLSRVRVKGQLVSSNPPGEERAPGPLWSEPGTLLEHVAVAVLGMDDEDRICYWGPGARRLFGYEAADVLSKPAATLFPAAPLDGTSAAERLAERGRTLGY